MKGMSVTYCGHEQCEPYNSCQVATDYERRSDFWGKRAWKIPTDDLGTDPLAWLNGDTPGE
jgi:hypothetical protein